MKTIKVLVPSILALIVGCCLVLSLERGAAQSNSSLPALIQAGFALWTKGGGIDTVLTEWQKGGLLEGDNRATAYSSYFKRLNWATGSYKGYDVLQTKNIGRSSQVMYLSINFERGAVYGRFVLYRGEKGWVVQNMDFNTKPEAVMPWLAFEGEKEY